MVIMNRYQPLCPPILNPEGIPLGGTDPAADKVLQRCTKAREKANGDLKQGSYIKGLITYVVNSYYSCVKKSFQRHVSS